MECMGPFAMIDVTGAISFDLLFCSKEGGSAELEPSSDHPGKILLLSSCVKIP